MNSNLNNTNEHSYLCLVAIYAIHVVVFHLYSPSHLPIDTNSHPARLQPMARWRARSTLGETRRNFTGSVLHESELPLADRDSDANETLQGRIPPPRVIGRVQATVGQFPHQVSLRRSKTGVHFCGGSIIDEEWIVTAAHCMYSNGKLIAASTIKVYAGDLLLNEPSSRSQTRAVRRVVVHQDFDVNTLRNDIALLKLRSKLTLDDEAVAAKALRNETVADGTPCQVSGWGVTKYKNTALSNELLYIDIPVVDRTLCRELMANFSDIPQVMICAGYIEGGFDSCQGDSGGGMICDDMLTGVVSWGKECGLANFPGIYTNVYVFSDWIVETIATSASSPTSAKGWSPAAWGVFLGCLVFLFTYTDRERVESEPPS
ncbi:trypsin-like isoform X1 [Neodiprion pinetum]|uniref:trypsin-like isoform X1 n=1 Tax=Neodiprion pinetum TaxID=441929 RepID=UPI001EDF2653|nr:trypsin-like isoform X1 [Neodiprion pinetum]